MFSKRKRPHHTKTQSTLRCLARTSASSSKEDQALLDRVETKVSASDLSSGISSPSSDVLLDDSNPLDSEPPSQMSSQAWCSAASLDLGTFHQPDLVASGSNSLFLVASMTVANRASCPAITPLEEFQRDAVPPQDPFCLLTNLQPLQPNTALLPSSLAGEVRHEVLFHLNLQHEF